MASILSSSSPKGSSSNVLSSPKKSESLSENSKPSSLSTVRWLRTLAEGCPENAWSKRCSVIEYYEKRTHQQMYNCMDTHYCKGRNLGRKLSRSPYIKAGPKEPLVTKTTSFFEDEQIWAVKEPHKELRGRTSLCLKNDVHDWYLMSETRLPNDEGKCGKKYGEPMGADFFIHHKATV